MEVLEPRKDKMYVKICTKCMAKLGYHESDIKYWVVPPKITKYGRTIDGVGFPHIVCPCCGTINKIESK